MTLLSFLRIGILIADTNNHRVRRVDLSTGLIFPFAGNGINSVTGNKKLSIEASVASPKGLAVDKSGTVYIATLHQIRYVYNSEQDQNYVIDLFAGAKVGNSGDGVLARDAEFSNLGGLALDTDGSIVVADTGNNKLRRIKKEGNEWYVYTIAGTGNAGSAGDGGIATKAELNGPSDVAISSVGEIFIADKFGNRIRMIKNDIITTVYDSTIGAKFARPLGISVYKDLYMYFCGEDQYVRRLDLFALRMGILKEELVAGGGLAEFSGENQSISSSLVNYPSGLDSDSTGNLYFADWYNYVIRKVSIPKSELAPTPTPTITPTPTFTPTPGITPSPTRTPKTRTATPTNTPYPTATPTSTPTRLPEGQLVPEIASGISKGPNFEFFTNYTSVIIPSATNTGTLKVFLSSSPDGKGSLLTKDTIALAVQQPAGNIAYATITFQDLGKPQPPKEITNLFAIGRNTVSVRLIDSKGAGYSSFPLYVVVFTAPVIHDIPDIRTLVNEETGVVYSLDDYVYDRDTPLEDLQWAFIIDPEGPEIIRGARHSISIGAYPKPADFVMGVSISDGIFSVSESVKIKVSTFRFDQFVLPDAPLLEDLAYVSPYSLRYMVDPPDMNIGDVPFETFFDTGKGMKAVHAPKGQLFMFPDFPGGKVTKPLQISVRGRRTSNIKDMDAAVAYAASVFAPDGSVPERNMNFTAPTLADLAWDVVVPGDSAGGEISIGAIPLDPVTVITDGYGLTAAVNPGENIGFLSQNISLPPGPTTISVWFAVEKLDHNNTDLPMVTVALLENSSNLSYTTVRGDELLGESRYQYIRTTYDVIGPKAQALIQVAGSQKSGRAEVYFDNIRVFPSAREIDRGLGFTKFPVKFDGTFEYVLKGLGNLVKENEQASYGSTVLLQKGINHTVYPSGFNQSLMLSMDEPESAIQVEIGPNPIDESFYPRELTTRVFVSKLREGGWLFCLGIDEWQSGNRYIYL